MKSFYKILFFFLNDGFPNNGSGVVCGAGAMLVLRKLSGIPKTPRRELVMERVPIIGILHQISAFGKKNQIIL